MNPINEALEQGYDEDEVLNYITHAFPHLRKKIHSALSTGHNTQQIIQFLGGVLNSSTPYQKPPSGSSQQSIHAIKKKEDDLRQQKLLKAGLSVAGTALAGRALPYVAKQISPFISKRGIPQAPGTKAPSLTPETPQGVAAQPIQAPPQPGIVPTVSSTESIIKEMGLDHRIKNLLNAKNPPEDVGKIIKSMLTPGQKTWLKGQTEKPVEEIVNEYIQSGQVQEKPPSKMALLPDGQVGNLVDERQGIATVELPDGKTRTRKLDELIEEPEDAAVTALELIKSFTPEEQRSTHHAVSFYDPDDNSAFFLFHGGDAYKVDDVNPEEYQKLSQEVVGAKTTGETLRGQWSSGAGSRGAAYHQIVKLGNKPYKKLQVGYDLFREFQKRINEAERKRKKSERKGS